MSNLNKYTKQEIISAIENLKKYNHYRLDIEIESAIEDVRREEKFKAEQQALKEEIDCMEEFEKWRKEMGKKYGKDGKFYIKDLTRAELERGAYLEKKRNDAIIAYNKITERKSNG